MLNWFALALTLWLAAMLGVAVIYRRALFRLWREPVLRYPVLIVESDDWGAGPLEQATALARIQQILLRHRDETDHPAVMSLALILAIPAPRPLGQDQPYRRRTLNEAEFEPVLAAIKEGEKTGVFALQLHGMEHGWPSAWIEAAKHQPHVADWLANPGATESLPSHLQSRWTYAASLPSRPHATDAIQAAVAEEVETFSSLFGHGRGVGAPSGANVEDEGKRWVFAPEGAPTNACSPLVVVPPTFVWDARVEAAWAAHGVGVVITPGRRLTCRDAAGKPACQDKTMLNGEMGEQGVCYLVRDDYFEPGLGHHAEQAIQAFRAKTHLGRPCLLETHRFNFLGEQASASLAELERLFEQAKAARPHVRFLSPLALAQAMSDRAADLVVRDFMTRLRIWVRRAGTLPRFSRLGRLTGLLPLLSWITHEKA